ncbi:DEAD/DEAH box helicase [Argonema antarcticum]|uniref:DEAD/DEAH box helicase n=1 Tax=Argonema antarcticum TaxID=2942763 RepID=UPI00201384D1
MLNPQPLQQVYYQLRPYQLDLLSQVESLWSQGKRRVLMALPTGAGKTVIFSAITHKFTAKQLRVLVVVHREELLLQALEKLCAVTGEKVGLIKAGYREDRSHLVQIASVQSLLRRQLPEADLLIIDEAHHSVSRSWTRLLEHYKDSYILGVTATPARIDGQGFKFLYDELVCGPDVRWLIDRNYLCSFKLFAAPQQIKIRRPKTLTGRDYTQKELVAAVNTSLSYGDLISSWRKFAPASKTVVFAVSVDHSKAIALAYREAGIAAEHLDGDTPPEERKAILGRFISGKTLILCNCGIVSEGFDVPSLEAVQIVRPTKSLILWLQMVGRSLRPHPGKEAAIIIDHTENWTVFGAPDQPWEWRLDPVSLKDKRWNVCCPECCHVFKPLPHEQKPYKYEWSPGHGEFKLWCKYICPNCLDEIEMEKWSGGEPPPPRQVYNHPGVEMREIPTDCDWQFLGELYRIVGAFRRKRSGLPILPNLANFLVQQYPNLGIPELRECALFYTKDFQWAVAWATKYYDNLVQEQKEAAAQKARQAQLERLNQEVSKASTWAEIFNAINSYSHIFNPQEVISRLPVEQQVRISQLRQEERKRSTVAAVVSSLSWDAVTLALKKGGFLLADILDFLPFSEQARLVELAIPSDSRARRFSEDEENQALPRQNFGFRFEKLYYWRLIQLSQSHKPIWLYYKLIEYNPQPRFEELSECARLLGYKRGWVYHKWRELYPDDKYFGSPDFFSRTYYSTSVVPQVVSSSYEDLDSDDCYGWDALDDEVYSFELERAESELIWYQQQFEDANS